MRTLAPAVAPRRLGALLGVLLGCNPGPEAPALDPPPAPDVRQRAAWQASLAGNLRCPGLAGATGLCLATDTSGQVHLVDLDADPADPAREAHCPANAFTPGGAFAWLGDQLYACDDRQAAVVAVDLDDGALRVAPLAGGACFAVTRWGTRILVVGQSVQVFDRFEDIAIDRPVRVIPGLVAATRAAVIGDILYGAWHSTRLIERLDLTTGARLPPLELELDDWIFALGASAAGELLLVRPSRLVDGVEVRDPATGAVLRTLPAGRAVQDVTFALACDGVLLPPSPPAAAPGDPVRLSGACESGPPAGFDAGPVAGPEVHVVGVYVASTGTVAVHLDRPGPAQLVLLGYEPVHWVVTTGPMTTLGSVVVSGYHRATVDAPATAAVERRIFEEGGTPLGYAFDWHSYEARRLRYTLETTLGTPMRSFSGCPAGERFVLR